MSPRSAKQDALDDVERFTLEIEHLRNLRDRAAIDARRNGCSWSDLAKAADMSVQGVRKRWRPFE